MFLDTTVFIGLLVIIVTGVLFLVLRHPRVNTVFVQSIPDRPNAAFSSPASRFS